MEIEWQYRIIENIRGDGSRYFSPQERIPPIGDWYEIGIYRATMEMAQMVIDERIISREEKEAIRTVEHIYPPRPSVPDPPEPTTLSGQIWKRLWIWGKH